MHQNVPVEIMAVTNNIRHTASCFSAYVVIFHSMTNELNWEHQNSGTTVIGFTTKYSSGCHRDPIAVTKDFFGVLEEVLELVYCEKVR